MRLCRTLVLGTLCALPLGALAAGAAAPNGLHLGWLDRGADPAKDFFTFANGGWQKQNPIPPAYSRWGTFSVLVKQNQEVIRQILEDAAQDARARPGSDERKVGDFYASGMDEKAIDAAGVEPLRPELERIGAMKGPADLRKELAHLQQMGVSALFDFGQMQDFKDSTKVIGAASQGGLGLPDRDYYLEDDPKFRQVRDAYVAHVAAMFELMDDGNATAQAEARTVMDIETRLARASMPRVDQRKPENVYHPMDLRALEGVMPGFSWSGYFADVGHPEITSINLAMPEFFKAMNADLSAVPLDAWKTYLRWHLLHAFAPYLSRPFVDEHFRLTKALTGAQELLPRWQRVVGAEDAALGFAVGKLYVEKKFPPSSRKAVLRILHGIRDALKADLATLAWMSPATRKAALEKLDLMGERIGYPDRWRDYSALRVDRGPYVLNVMRANAFLQRRELAKIGKPVDKDEWSMTPQTVNAYYDPSMNNINFPAGILQPPFFDPKAPAAVNEGALGFVMGHEMTHGFDDQGARFDGHGNLLPEPGWWTAADFEKFKAATDCISDHFSRYTVDGDLHVQGKLVTGEATADLGGLTLAWRAFQASPASRQEKAVDGFTPAQQFFLGAAHVWAMNIRPEEARRLVTIDPHPPAVDRVNGTVANMPAFQEAFHVPAGSPMVNADRCVIW